MNEGVQKRHWIELVHEPVILLCLLLRFNNLLHNLGLLNQESAENSEYDFSYALELQIL